MGTTEHTRTCGLALRGEGAKVAAATAGLAWDSLRARRASAEEGGVALRPREGVRPTLAP